MVGETMRYVATDADGEWVGLVGFGSAALACRPRDTFIGWTPEIQFRRLRYVAANQRFCVLPAGSRPNTASAVMARTLRRLSTDWVEVWGHPVFLVETFVDPARHVGTCYSASSFTRIGQTAGYGRRSGRYVQHGEVKDVYIKTLHRHTARVLAGSFDHPLLTSRNLMAQIDFNTADLASLANALDTLIDSRDARGVRHSQTTTLMLVACGTLAGHKSMIAISEWAEAAPQEVLVRLDARISPRTGLRIPPSYATIRRALLAVDPERLDRIVNTWAGEQAAARASKPSRLDEEGDSDHDSGGGGGGGGGLVGVAVDGKTLRGAKRNDGTQTQLLAAMRHDTGTVISQVNVENHKTNEIRAFAPLLEPLDLTGMVVTADALHTQRSAAQLLATKACHYLFGVKMNQPTLWNTANEILNQIDLDHTEFETMQRGHGRIDRHRIWTAPVPDTITFPGATRFVFVEREASTLADVRTSIEYRIYITDLTPTQTEPEHLHRLINGHWTIENSLHWVRDVTFDEDRSQVRTGTTPRVLATLRNLAISAIRYATDRTVNIAAATRQLARQPDTALDLLGVKPRLCT